MRLTLTREIIVSLAVKLLALVALWYFFFSSAHRPVVNDAALAHNLLQESHQESTP